MVKLTINGQQVSVPEGMTIMEAAEKVGVHIPHLCYLKDINEIGACRVCLVELKGMEKLVTACNTICRRGHGDTDKQSACQKNQKNQCGADPFRP